MMILLCLMAIISSCSGGISSGYEGNLVQEIEIEPQQLEHFHQGQFLDQGHQQQQHEIFNVQSVGNAGDYGGGQSEAQSGWQPISDIQSHNSQPQIIKVIHEPAQDSHGRHGGQGFGGQSQPQIFKIIEEQSFSNNHGNNGYSASSSPHQIIKVIEEQSHGGFSGHGGGHGGFGGHGSHGGFGGHGGKSHGPNFGGHASPSDSDPQIIFSDPPSISSKPSQSSNLLSSLTSFFPQFLSLIFGGGNSQRSPLPSLPSLPSLPKLPSLGGHGHGHRPINTPNAGKLINSYGYGGKAKITKGGKLNSYYKSGRVIESGTLKIASVKRGKW